MLEHPILWTLLILIGGVIILAIRKPDTFQVLRSQTIKAAPDRIFPLINDLTAWQTWSPWEEKDPDMQRTLSGPGAGVGAAYAWEGNRNVGSGRMEIIESEPGRRIRIQLQFFKPFPANNIAEFTLEPEGDATIVTWTLSGPMPFFSKVMTVFFSMDKMVGKDFEAGLGKLQRIAEASGP